MGDSVKTPPPLEVILSPPRSSGDEDSAKKEQKTDPELKDAPPGQNPDDTTFVAATTVLPVIPECIPRIIAPPTPREIRLQKAMKPMVRKCIPDKESRYVSDSRYKAPPRLGVGNRDKDDLIRRSSKLVFTMPKVREPEEIEELRREKMIHKLIKYMKKSWRIKVDSRQPERDLVYRTTEAVHTRHPDNYEELQQEREELIEKRGETSKQRGFFCGYDANYPSIYSNVEVDTAMLVFHNLPPDLKISAARWLKMKAFKEELKRKRDAFLPRPPHNKSRRPNFSRGKLFKDPGGMNELDECLRVGERFRQLCKGNHWYARVLENWQYGRDDKGDSANFHVAATPSETEASDVTTAHKNVMIDIANLANDEEPMDLTAPDQPKIGGWLGCGGGGSVKAGTKKGGTVGFKDGSKRPKSSNAGEDGEDDEDDSRTDSAGPATNERRESLLDGRKYQREMLQMEYMILAIYDLIKSMLNIKIKQLKSNLPLPNQVVMQLRDYSPEPKKPAPAPAPVKSGIVVKRRGQTPSAMTAASSKSKLPGMEELTEAEFSDDENCIEMENAIRASMQHDEEEEDIKPKSLRETMSELDPFHIHAIDIIKPRKFRSSHRILEEIKRVHSMQEKMAAKHKQLSAVAKIKSLAETPDHAAQRLARNAATYGRLFERRQRPKAPVWHHIHVEDYVTKFASKDQNVLTKDPANLTEADAEEVVEMAIRKREMLPTSRRWPDSDDIPTPTFPFAGSPRRVGSEELSKRNLLSTMPHMDDVPGTPVRRLYKLAGVRTTEKQTFNMMFDMKRQFRGVEKKVRNHTENEIWQKEFDTVRRYKNKLPAIYPDPIYEWCIGMMRGAMKVSGDEDDEEGNLIKRNETGGIRRQAMWYRKLKEECSSIGAIRHNGCQQALEKLFKFCDIDLKSKPQLISRFALLIVSLPTTELGNRDWQTAIQFLLENFFNAPKEILLDWLQYRSLPLVT